MQRKRKIFYLLFTKYMTPAACSLEVTRNPEESESEKVDKNHDFCEPGEEEEEEERSLLVIHEISESFNVILICLNNNLLTKKQYFYDIQQTFTQTITCPNSF